MSILSFFRRRRAESPTATPEAASAAPVSSPQEALPAPIQLRTSHERPRQQRPAAQPESEGALARSIQPDDDGEPRPKRRRRRHPKAATAATQESGTPERVLFPLPNTPGLFSELPAIERACAEAGWTVPTPIQERSMPVLRANVDLVGQAQTGSGKTGAFGIPLLEKLDPDLKAVQAMVVVPTRELAEQVTKELARLGKYAGLRPVSVYGGVGYEHQVQGIRRGDQIVVGTPGRILDHLERGTLSFEDVRLVILDEADRMLDMGFQPDVERILRYTPNDRQTALFSATIPTEIHELIFRYLHDAEWIRIEMKIPTVDTVEQIYYEVAERDKFDGLKELLEMKNWPSVLIFRRTQRGVDRLVGLLQRKRYSVAAIHGGMSQAERQRALNDYAAGHVRILVATNVASRGLDIPNVSHVLNYDMPEDFDTYVHRVGRTARIGRRGTAVTFVAESQDDWQMFELLQKQLKDQFQPRRLALYG